jgi:hypothetical protein
MPTPAIGGWLNTALGMHVIVHPVRLAAEDRVGERLTLADRDGVSWTRLVTSPTA